MSNDHGSELYVFAYFVGKYVGTNGILICFIIQGFYISNLSAYLYFLLFKKSVKFARNSNFITFEAHLSTIFTKKMYLPR